MTFLEIDRKGVVAFWVLFLCCCRRNRSVLLCHFPLLPQFPPARIRRYLKKGRFSNRLTAGAPVFMAAVLEYLVRFQLLPFLSLSQELTLDFTFKNRSPRL